MEPPSDSKRRERILSFQRRHRLSDTGTQHATSRRVRADQERTSHSRVVSESSTHGRKEDDAPRQQAAHGVASLRKIRTRELEQYLGHRPRAAAAAPLAEARDGHAVASVRVSSHTREPGQRQNQRRRRRMSLAGDALRPRSPSALARAVCEPAVATPVRSADHASALEPSDSSASAQSTHAAGRANAPVTVPARAHAESQDTPPPDAGESKTHADTATAALHIQRMWASSQRSSRARSPGPHTSSSATQRSQASSAPHARTRTSAASSIQRLWATRRRAQRAAESPAQTPASGAHGAPGAGTTDAEAATTIQRVWAARRRGRAPAADGSRRAGAAAAVATGGGSAPHDMASAASIIQRVWSGRRGAPRAAVAAPTTRDHATRLAAACALQRRWRSVLHRPGARLYPEDDSDDEPTQDPSDTAQDDSYNEPTQDPTDVAQAAAADAVTAVSSSKDPDSIVGALHSLASVLEWLPKRRVAPVAATMKEVVIAACGAKRETQPHLWTLPVRQQLRHVLTLLNMHART